MNVFLIIWGIRKSIKQITKDGLTEVVALDFIRLIGLVRMTSVLFRRLHDHPSFRRMDVRASSELSILENNRDLFFLLPNFFLTDPVHKREPIQLLTNVVELGVGNSEPQRQSSQANESVPSIHPILQSISDRSHLRNCTNCNTSFSESLFCLPICVALLFSDALVLLKYWCTVCNIAFCSPFTNFAGSPGPDFVYHDQY